MKILNFHRYHRPECKTCNSNGYYYVFPIPDVVIRTSDPLRISKQLGNKPKKVYCSCEWGRDLYEKRKEINDLPADNPLKNMTDDEIRESLKPVYPTYVQSLNKEEFDKLYWKNMHLAWENYLKDKELKIFQNKQKLHFK